MLRSSSTLFSDSSARSTPTEQGIIPHQSSEPLLSDSSAPSTPTGQGIPQLFESPRLSPKSPTNRPQHNLEFPPFFNLDGSGSPDETDLPTPADSPDKTYLSI